MELQVDRKARRWAWRCAVGVALLWLGAPGRATGATADAPLPAGGESLFAGDVLERLHASGKGDLGDATLVAVTNAPVRTALRVRSLGATPTPWGFQVTAPVERAISKGDTLFVEFWLRTIESAAETGEARTEFVLELNKAPNTKSINLPASAGSAWQRHRAPFRAVADYPVGTATICFRAGYGRQTYELGGVRVLGYGRRVTCADLPRTQIWYAGCEPQAAWRAAAAERIARLRMADLTLRVRDAAGNPVPGALVSVEQVRQSFKFGSAVAAHLVVAPDLAEAARYRAAITSLFNTVVLENDLKWPAWEDEARRRETLQAIAWFRTNGLDVRGHCLVWPAWRFLPRGLAALTNDLPRLRDGIRDHIRSEVGATRGQILQWDVINEPYNNHDLMDLLGREAMLDWFREARAADPAPVLFLNDFASLVAGGTMTEHKRHFEATARWIKESGAPIGGLGLQCHFGQELTPPERLLAELDRLQAIGLPLMVTEWDIATTDDEVQAAYTRDFLTAMFSHPAVEGVLTWGFWEGRHWRPEAALYETDWTEKPNGAAWRQLVRQQWWTRAKGQTDAAGCAMIRVYQGTHRVSVSTPEGTLTVLTEVARSGAVVDVTVTQDRRP